MKFSAAAVSALISLAATSSVAASSSTNLVVNGSFEKNTVKAGTWTTFKAADVEGWQPLTAGASFEMWGKGFGGITPPEGNNILEIDVHGSTTGTDGLFQYLTTKKDQEYEISFSIRARRSDIKSASEAVVVEWNDVKTSRVGYYASKVGEWERVKIIVKGTGHDKLLFRETTTTKYNDSLGPLMDDVVVTEYHPTPSAECGPDNMIINCSFEDTKMKDNTYKFFPAGQVLGWKSLNGEPLELWGKDYRGVSASRGNNLLELDAHARSLDGVYQIVKTEKDQLYKITFDVHARSNNVDSLDESVFVQWNGAMPDSKGYRAAKRGEWTTHTVIVKGTGSPDGDKLVFMEAATKNKKVNDSTGPFLDSIHMGKYTAPVKQASTCANGNLIKNCSFEDNDVEANTWTLISDNKVPGWTSIDGQPIEFWGLGFQNIPASHGSQFIEMDAHASGKKTDGIYQMVQTKKGQKYQVSFDVRARSKAVNTDDESVVFEFNGKKLANSGYKAKNAAEWYTHTVVVEGTGAAEGDKVLFRETTTASGDDGSGPFLDNLIMVEFNETPRTASRDGCGPNNLIENCSFEGTEVRPKTWSFYNPDDVPAWTSVNGEKLELWNDYRNVKASAGQNFLEMDAGRAAAGDGIFQLVKTEKGAHYALSFDVRARGGNHDSDDEAIVIEFNGEVLKDAGYRAANKGEWTRHTVTVVGTGGEDKVLFREIPAANDSTGPFLDNIYMRKRPVPVDLVKPIRPICVFPKPIDDCGVDGNMIENCSFEANVVKENTFAWFGPDAVTGWKSLNGQDLEIWGKNFKNVAAASGNQFLEIDAHSKSTDGVYQEMKTVKGQEYVVSFDVRARSSSVGTDDEACVVEFNGVKTQNKGYHAAKKGVWTTHTLVVMGTGNVDRLTFRETTTKAGNDSTGPFLDNVSMVPRKAGMMSTDDKAESCGQIKGNLVANCSFEKTKVKGNTFAWFKPADVPDWVSMNGEDIELWGEGFKGVHASDGLNLIEIDSHKASRTSTDGISQVLDTVAGEKYVITFDMRARGNNVDSKDETLVLKWNGVKTENTGYRATQKGEWKTYSATVTAVGNDKISFSESTVTTANDSTGPFLDNISVVALNPTPRSAPKDTCGADNLIKNCSFEANQLPDRTWKPTDAADIPHWMSLNGQKIELWGSNMAGVPCPDGNTFVELDLHGGNQVDGIYQMVQTKKGVVYEISYQMRARGKAINNDDEAVVVEFNDKKLIMKGQHADEAGEWVTNKVLVTGTGAAGGDKVTFRETTTSGNDGTGPFLDDISMKAVIVDNKLVVPDECGADNLVINCSFEYNPMKPGTWTWMGADQVLGWKSLEGQKLELWGNGFAGVKAPHGQNFLEIDSHGTGLDGIWQTLNTVAGKMYTVEFDVRSRGKTPDSDDEAVYLMWNDKVPKASGYRATKFGEWRTVSAIVMAQGNDKLTFRESTTASDNSGPFIDNIKVLPMDRTTTRPIANPDDCGKNNMVKNCSFEANIVPDASMLRFKAADVPGWQSMSGASLEFWSNGFLSTDAAQGNVFLEIDNGGGSANVDGVFQLIKTISGQYYTIRFDMRARGDNVNSNDESIVLEWNGEKLSNTGYKAQTAGSWTTVEVFVVGTGGEDKLAFRESTSAGASDGTGPFLDNIHMAPSKTLPLQSSDGDCAPENMIENCSFERNVVPDASMRRFRGSSVPGWTSLNGQSIELWSSGFDNNSQGPTTASQGSVFMELDNFGSSSIDGIFQLVKTVKDQEYSLSFDIRARSANVDSNDEAVVLEFNGVKLEKTGYRATDKGEWHTITAIVVGTGADGGDKITFRESTTKSANDGSGPFLDNIVMKPVPDKPDVDDDDDDKVDSDPRSGSKDCGVAGNLVENCSFEANEIPDGKWKLVDPNLVPGWESYNGDKLELWGDMMGRVGAPHGKNFLELDVHGGSKIDGVFQNIPTKAGQDYEVTFQVRARKAGHFARPDEAIHLLWNGKDAKATGFTAEKGGVWTTIKAIVTGTSADKDQLLFRESSIAKASDGSGPLLDMVSVVPVEKPVAPVDPVVVPGADSCGVPHNMVENCSFEQTKVPDNTWLLYDEKDVPGWKSLEGERLELWGKDFRGVVAPDGNILHELDAHRSGDKTDGIYQMIQTEKDRVYSVTFSIRARGNNPDTDDEAVVLEFNDVKLTNSGYRASAKGEWTVITAKVVGTGGVDKLTFRESTVAKADDSTGPFIDKIIMIPTTETRTTTKPPFDPCSVDGNLLINCSFEQGVAKGTWTSLKPDEVDGWKSLNGNDLEVWGTEMAGVEPKEGLNFLELDYTGSATLDGVYQEVSTKKDQDYSITFNIRSRSNAVTSDDESVVVEFNGKIVESFTATAHGTWTTVTTVVTGTGGTDKVVFRETSTSAGNDGSGPFLDMATMTPVKPAQVAVVDCGKDNLVKNCSFETGVPDGTILETDQVAAWKPLLKTNFKIWGQGTSGVKTTSGQNFLELDNNGSGAIDGVYQIIPTEKGKHYVLSFDVRLRTDDEKAEAVLVRWNGQQPKAGGFKISGTEWVTHTAIVTGQNADGDKLILQEYKSHSDGSGPLLDNIRLVPMESPNASSDCGAPNNLVINCSFEENKLPEKSMLRFGEEHVPGWHSYKRTTLELWADNFRDTPASDGVVFLELDNAKTGALDGIYQLITTEKGQYYKVTFDVRARGSDVNTDDEAVVLEWNDKKAKNDGYRASKAGEWTRVHAYVMGTGQADKLLFRESTTDSDGTGPFLDNISVVPVTDPFAPSISLSNGVYLNHDDGESCGTAGHYAEGAKGTKVTYCFTVTNTGDTYLSNIKLEDTTLDYSNAAVGSLAPGGSVTVSYEATIGSTMQNEAKVTANPADKFGQDIPRLEDVVAHSKDASSVGVGLTTLAPTVTATSSPTVSPIMSIGCGVTVYTGGDDNGVGCGTATNSIKAMKGSTITLCFFVTNTGSTPMTDIKLVDNGLGFTDSTIGTLPPGDSATVIYTTTVDDNQTTDVTVTGQPADDSGKALPNKDIVTSTSTDPATIEAIKPEPKVSLVAGAYVGDDMGVSCSTKAASSVSADTGDSMVYCFKVKNDGNTDLSNVVIKATGIDFTSNSIGNLAPGDSQEVDYVYTVDANTGDSAVATITANPTLADGSSMADPVTDSSTVHMVVAGDTRSGNKPSLLTGTGDCIENNWKDAGNTEELLCATRDIFIESGASDKPLQCTSGEKVKVTIDASIRFRDITPRYDVAWYVATDGGDAMTGTCSTTALSKASTDYSIVASSGSDKVVGSVVWDATDGDGDECGDVVITSGTDGANLDIPLVVDLEVPCVDDNEDGLLDVAVCFTWRQDCNNDVCSFTAGVIPGNPTTGCYCTRVDVSNTEVDTPVSDPIVPC